MKPNLSSRVLGDGMAGDRKEKVVATIVAVALHGAAFVVVSPALIPPPAGGPGGGGGLGLMSPGASAAAAGEPSAAAMHGANSATAPDAPPTTSDVRPTEPTEIPAQAAAAAVVATAKDVTARQPVIAASRASEAPRALEPKQEIGAEAAQPRSSAAKPTPLLAEIRPPDAAAPSIAPTMRAVETMPVREPITARSARGIPEAVSVRPPAPQAASTPAPTEIAQTPQVVATDARVSAADLATARDVELATTTTAAPPAPVVAKAPETVSPPTPPRRPEALKSEPPAQRQARTPAKERPQPKPAPRRIAEQPKPTAQPAAQAPSKIARAPSESASVANASGERGQASASASGGGGAGRASGGPAGGGLAALGAGTNDGDARNAYAQKIRAILEREKRYPRRAQMRGRQGVVYAVFTVDRTGRISNARIQRGSGVRSLDRETMALLDRAHLPPMPADIRSNKLTFTVPISFALR